MIACSSSRQPSEVGLIRSRARRIRALMTKGRNAPPPIRRGHATEGVLGRSKGATLDEPTICCIQRRVGQRCNRYCPRQGRQTSRVTGCAIGIATDGLD